MHLYKTRNKKGINFGGIDPHLYGQNLANKGENDNNCYVAGDVHDNSHGTSSTPAKIDMASLRRTISILKIVQRNYLSFIVLINDILIY